MSRIISTPEVINGNPRVAGTRLSVLDVIIACSERGMSQVLEDWAELTVEDLRDAVVFCEARECVKLEQHCGGCTLRLEQDQIHTMKDFINRFAEVKFVDSDDVITGTGEGSIIMPGKVSTLNEYWRGLDGWKIANTVRELEE